MIHYSILREIISQGFRMHNLVELKAICPGIALDIVYATPNNFTGKPVYSMSCCFLLSCTAERLKRVENGLKKQGLGLKVYDGYRPLSVQKEFWKLVPDPRYVADPAVGSKHNRGAAVDVTLIDREGRDLSMPTSLDDFTEKAHRNYKGGSKEALDNSRKLEKAMAREGFVPLATEWWHFDDPEWKKYPILDLSFEELTGR
jgi:D-alanyl-D-alanine dipeptidase